MDVTIWQLNFKDNGMSKDRFKPCPKCYSEVEVVSVQRHESPEMENYYFVNCQFCGEGTQKAFKTVDQLMLAWNQKVESSVVQI